MANKDALIIKSGTGGEETKVVSHKDRKRRKENKVDENGTSNALDRVSILFTREFGSERQDTTRSRNV